jgi:hypothetical protein
MLHPWTWAELLLVAWVVSAVMAATLLDSDRRAGTGLLLGLAGGPVGAIVAYRMHLAALAGRALPQDGRYGAMIRAYIPPRPSPAATLARPVIMAAGLAFAILGRVRYGSWKMYAFLVVAVYLAVRFRAGPEDRVVAVFDEGIMLGRRFIAWRDLRDIKHYPSAPEPDLSGNKTPRSDWIFNRKRGEPVTLNLPTAGYVDTRELNALVAARVTRGVVPSQSSA